MPRVLAEPRAMSENTNQTAMTYGELCLLKISANLCEASKNFCVIHAICGLKNIRVNPPNPCSSSIGVFRLSGFGNERLAKSGNMCTFAIEKGEKLWH